MKNRTVYIVENANGEHKIFSSYQRAMAEALKVYDRFINNSRESYTLESYARDLKELINTSRIDEIVYVFDADFEDTEIN